MSAHLTRRLRLSLLQILAALAMFPLFFAFVSWLAAESPKDNSTVPASWKAGVMNHGQFYQWRFGTISDSPVAFASCTILLAGCLLFLIVSSIRATRERERKDSAV